MNCIIFEYFDGHMSFDSTQNLCELNRDVIAFTISGVQYQIGVPIKMNGKDYTVLSDEQLKECSYNDVYIVYYQQGQYQIMPMSSSMSLVDSFEKLNNIYCNLLQVNSNLTR